MNKNTDNERSHTIKRRFFSHTDHGRWEYLQVVRAEEISRFDNTSRVITYILALLDENGKKEVISYLEFNLEATRIHDIANDILKILHENREEIHADYGIKLRKSILRLINRLVKTEKSFNIKLDNESTALI